MSRVAPIGSITFTDITDVSEFSSQLMCDKPLTVVYDPDQLAYIPDWSDTHLTVTPLFYYAGQQVALGTTGLTVSWMRREDSGIATSLITGETVTNGVLEVSENMFTDGATQITYLMSATYAESTSGMTLSTQSQITFSLINNASTTKTCVISGDSVFKYNTDQQIVGQTSITLTARVDGVSIVAWQYQNAQQQWVTYPNSTTGPSLTVNANDSTFSNDKCVIRLTTDDQTIYDLHTITKLRDGAAGSNTVSAVLTNDDQMVPFDSEGHGDFSAAISQIIIYEGGTDVTSTWTIRQTPNGVTSTPSQTSSANDTVTVSAMSGNVGNVLFTCEKEGYNAITKTFSLVKVESGADGESPTIYSLEADTYAINKKINGSYSPTQVIFSAYEQTGTSKTAYNGRFKIFEDITLAEYDAASPKPTAKYTSSTDESSRVYTPTATATSILCILYAAGGTTTRYDSQLVAVTNDGANAVNVVLGNYADVLTCTAKNRTASNQTVTIPFKAFEGTTAIACTASSVQLLGVTPTVTAATSSSEGSIVWAIPAGTDVSTANGTLTLTFTATTSKGAVTTTENYSWSRNSAATDAVLLQIYSQNGNVFNETVTSITMNGSLIEGVTDITSAQGVTWQWAKYTDGSYVNVSGGTSSSLTVAGSTVDSYASYRLRATYNTNNYDAFFSLFDKTDPVQVTVLSSIGTQLQSGQGVGGVYPKVTKNGREVDAMKSERFLMENPATASAGDYYYKIDTTNHTLTLMKYSNGAWSEATDTYAGTYTWSWRDKDGHAITTLNGVTLPTSGRVVYIDGEMIDEKIVIDVAVNI